ncbi:hypothetical protein [Catenulispora rubra]|uniref:hypothetical protein n=1 Tax=Catenulispora rubra TaxID=280293 RepID=UPI0018924D82|nr:hypothetical protein [Catenulispora rubra]
MTERNLTPGTGWANPAGPDNNRPDDTGGPLDHVKKAWQTPGGKLLTIIPAVIALIVGGVLGMSVGGGSKNTNTVTPGPTDFVTTTATTTAAGAVPPPATSATSSGSAAGPTATVSSTPTGTTPPTSPTGSQSALVPPEGGTVPLVDLAPVSGTWQSRDASPMINGTLQQFVLVQDIPEVNTNGDVGYNLGRYYTKLTGVIGLDDNSAVATMHPTIEIDGDGLKLATFTPTLGHPAQISLNVSSILRLDIKYASLDSTGNYSTGTTLILANGQLTPIPGYHPPAPTSS